MKYCVSWILLLFPVFLLFFFLEPDNFHLCLVVTCVSIVPTCVPLPSCTNGAASLCLGLVVASRMSHVRDTFIQFRCRSVIQFQFFFFFQFFRSPILVLVTVHPSGQLLLSFVKINRFAFPTPEFVCTWVPPTNLPLTQVGCFFPLCFGAETTNTCQKRVAKLNESRYNIGLGSGFQTKPIPIRAYTDLCDVTRRSVGCASEQKNEVLNCLPWTMESIHLNICRVRTFRYLRHSISRSGRRRSETKRCLTVE